MGQVFITRMAELSIKYIQGQLTPGEIKELKRVIGKSERNKNLFERITNPEWLFGKIKQLEEVHTEAAWEKFIKTK